MKIVSLIPARSGSKGIPDKNISNINGKRLIEYNIEASLGSKVDQTWVSTDSTDYKWISVNAGANVLMRPLALSDDDASSESALLHFAEEVDFDILVFLQCTSPLTTSEDIDNAINMLKTCDFDSVVSVCPDHGGWLCGGFTWEVQSENNRTKADYDLDCRPRRQDMNPKYRENGAIYVTTRERLLDSKCRVSGDIGLYIMPRERSYEIDEPEDLNEIRKHLNDTK